MRLQGKKGQAGLYYINAYLVSNKMKGTIRFCIDSGASETTINDEDAKRLGVDYETLERSPIPVDGIGGRVETFVLDSCSLLFDTGNEVLEEALPTVLVIRHKKPMALPSLLGLDILGKYTIKFSGDMAILDRADE